MRRIQSEIITSSSPSSLPSPFPHKETPTSPSKISPALLFIIIILAVLFFIAGLLHLLVRFLIKHGSASPASHSRRYPEMSGSNTVQRQLQQLFHLHDSGLDQSFIDSLPVFMYKEIKGLKEPFDCAVCLCEFSDKDKLRLLPLCSHAFHIDCIDTWLQSNSTCPLCRGNLFAPEFSIEENPCFNFEDDDLREEDDLANRVQFSSSEAEIASDKRVFPVRLGKFKSTNVDVGNGETSSSNLCARRCYSMGSFQYVVPNSELQVILRRNNNRPFVNGGSMRLLGKTVNSNNNNNNNNNSNSDIVDVEGKKINSRSKGDSFSVSKIWLWSKKGKFPSSETQMI